MENPNCIKVTSEELEGCLEEIENSSLKSKELLLKIIKGYAWIQQQLERSKLTIGRLKKCFQMTSEKWFKKDKKQSKKKSRKGHGRKSASAFNAEIIHIHHPDHKAGDCCPECLRGKLHQLPCGSILQIVGQPCLGAKHYKPERLRCALCGKVFRATHPGTIERVDITAKATVSLLKLAFFPWLATGGRKC